MIVNGCSIEKLREFPDNHFDSVVTDPPYGLAFMGKKWDYDVPSVELWREVFRVMKPGGHLLSFGGTRTYHRMVVNIEDAGFEIRDQLQWIYGSGFPKSHNLKDECEGWGTALKPANEPIVLARKPLEKGLTVAENVLRWGTGALNIDAGRIEASEKENAELNRPNKRPADGASGFMISTRREFRASQGRWPANVLFDEAAAELLDEQSGQLKAGGSVSGKEKSKPVKNTYGEFERKEWSSHNDSGGASRFFYVAKASKSERNKNCSEVMTWESVDLSPLMEELNQHLRDISEDTMRTLKDTSWSTDWYGHTISEQSQKALMFTISTVIGLITELKTSNCFQGLNTKESILAAIRTIEESGLNLAESVKSIKKLGLTTTKDEMEYLLGASGAVLETLLKIKNSAKIGNVHSTVKPIKLMEYLCKLITPPTGIILDPFCGSGSTGVAAVKNGFQFVGIERENEYCQIAEKRIAHAGELCMTLD